MAAILAGTASIPGLPGIEPKGAQVGQARLAGPVKAAREARTGFADRRALTGRGRPALSLPSAMAGCGGSSESATKHFLNVVA